MPQLVREARYFSHLEQGVEMSESISLASSQRQDLLHRLISTRHVPMASFHIVVVTTCRIVSMRCPSDDDDDGGVPEPTPPITNDLTALMVGKLLTDAI